MSAFLPANVIARELAEPQLRAHGCKPMEVGGSPPYGQWWEAYWGYRFFMQWFGADHEFFDEFQRQFMIEEIERHQPPTG